MFQCITEHRHCELIKYRNIRYYRLFCWLFGLSNTDVGFGVGLSEYDILTSQHHPIDP